MASGAGVFQRIVVTQEQGLGNLAAGRTDGMKALTTGGIGVGRTSSARFGVGGFTEGAAGAYEQGILNKMGVSSANTLQRNVANMMNYSQGASAGMSAAAVSFGKGPLGTGAFEGLPSTGVAKFGGQATTTPGAGISQVDVDSLKRTLVDIFSRISQDIINETIRRLRQ
jgi:hypothetical protein